MQLEPGQGLVCHLRVSGNQAAFHCLQYSELQDKVTSTETKVLEMETTVEDLQWDIEKLRKREQKLNKHLAEALEQVRERMEPNGELRDSGFRPSHALCLFSLQLNSGYYVSGSSSGFQGGQITLSMQKVSGSIPPVQPWTFPEGRHLCPRLSPAAPFSFIHLYT